MNVCPESANVADRVCGLSPHGEAGPGLRCGWRHSVWWAATEGYMIIAEQSFYLLVSAFALVSTLVCAAVARKFDGRARRYMLYAPAVTGLLALGYFAMSVGALTITDPKGEPVPVSRFATYMVSYTFVMAFIAMVGGASRRLGIAGIASVGGFTLGTLVNWLTPAPINVLGKVVVLSSLAASLYLLFKPYTRASSTVSGERRLLFGKVRNLMALLMTNYLIVGLISRQGLALLGTFTGVYIGGYIDILGHIGFAGLLLRSEDAIAELADVHRSMLDYLGSDDTRSPGQDATVSD